MQERQQAQAREDQERERVRVQEEHERERVRVQEEQERERVRVQEEQEREIIRSREEREERIEIARLNHDAEMRKLDMDERQTPANDSIGGNASITSGGRYYGPKLPAFDESKDNMDSYLQRF